LIVFFALAGFTFFFYANTGMEKLTGKGILVG